MRLYDIDQQIIKAIELGFDPETGEILDETALADLQMEREKKIENMLLYAKDLRADAEAIRNEEKTLKSRADAADKKADSILRYVQGVLAGEKFKTARCSVSYRKTQAVRIFDLDALPIDYVRVKTSTEPDKVMIKEAIKAGEKVPGAELEERQSMTVK